MTARPTGTDDGDVLEHFVLRRTGNVWRVVNVGVASHATGQTATGP